MPIEIPNSADSIAPTHALGQSSSDGVVARLSDREKLAYYERVIEQSVSLDPQRNEALFEIHEQKLYLLTHASFARYVDERWDLSCSRAHQIIRFVKLRRLSESSGQPPPVNERQARRLGAKQIGQDDYHRRFHRVTTYLRGKLRETPAAERERFTQDLRTFLKSLAQAFERLLPPPGKPAGSSQIERMTPVTADGNARPKNGIEHTLPPEASAPRTVGPLSRPLPGAPAVPPMNSVSSAINRPLSAAHAQPTNIQDRPAPSGRTGSLLGLTMEEARRLGYFGRKGTG